MARWENLPQDLLREIEKRLNLYVDKVRFSSVCRSWRSVPVLPKIANYNQQCLHLPWLLLACDEADTTQSSHALLNTFHNESYYLELHKADQGMFFGGSSYGWVVTFEATANEICLLNPLTRAKIQLPPRSKFPDVHDYCADNPNNEFALVDPKYGTVYRCSSTHVYRFLTDKIILSSSPASSDDYVAVAIYSGYCRLAYCKRGDERWSFLHAGRRPYHDAIFVKGKVYALTGDGIMDVIKIHPRHPRVRRAAPINPEAVGCETYLVESSIGLLMVVRHKKTWPHSDPMRKCHSYRTYKFVVFQRGRTEWCRVTDIGGDVLFLGSNASVSRSSRHFPGLKGNSIYFTDNVLDYHRPGIQGGFDAGVYHLESRRIEPLPGFKCDGDLVWPPPIWVTPTP